MNCDTCQSLLIELEHDELEPEQRVSVIEHLAGCSACALESCRLRAALEGIVDAYTEAPAPEVRVALRRRVERAVRPSWWVRLIDVLRRPVPAYAVASAAAAPLVAWAVVSVSGEVRPVPQPPSAPALTDYDGAAHRIDAAGVL